MTQYFQSRITPLPGQGREHIITALQTHLSVHGCRGVVCGEHLCPSRAVSPATAVPPRQGSPQLACWGSETWFGDGRVSGSARWGCAARLGSFTAPHNPLPATSFPAPCLRAARARLGRAACGRVAPAHAGSNAKGPCTEWDTPLSTRVSLQLPRGTGLIGACLQVGCDS